MMTEPLSVTALGERGAAEVRGLDCSQPFTPAERTAFLAAFRRYPILAVRGQRLDAPQQAAFSRQFGPLEDQHNAQYVHPDDPAVLILSNEIRPDGSAAGVVDAGDFMHSDSSHRPEPCLATILHAIVNPSRGGATDFWNMYDVYDALPERLKALVTGRFAVHHGSKTRNKRVAISSSRPGAAEFYETSSNIRAEVLQPMVRTHPETGRPALYVSPRFTIRVDGLDENASDALLDELFAFIDQERFRYRHEWHDGDLVIWDNRCLNHRATGGYVLPDIRRMHRTSVCGDRAFFRPSGS